MDIEINTYTKDERFRNYCFQIRSLEVGLDIVNQILTRGDHLVEAILIDDNESCLRLPIEAFNGENFSGPISQLQKEWEVILEKSLQSGIPEEPAYAALIRQRINQYESMIANQQLVIDRFKELLEYAEANFSAPRRFQIIDRYLSILNRYQIQHARASAKNRLLFHRLTALTAF